MKDTLGPAILSTIERLSSSLCTVEPPNKGHIETSHFVHYREAGLFLAVENGWLFWELSFLERMSFFSRSRASTVFS